MKALLLAAALLAVAHGATAQTAPSAAEVAAYDGLHRAAYLGDLDAIRSLIAAGADLDARDDNGRTPAHVAAFASNDAALEVLAAAPRSVTRSSVGGSRARVSCDIPSPLQRTVTSPR